MKTPRRENGQFDFASAFLRWFSQQFPGGGSVEHDAALKAWCARDTDVDRWRAEALAARRLLTCTNLDWEDTDYAAARKANGEE